MRDIFYIMFKHLRNRHLFMIDVFILSLIPTVSVFLRFESLDALSIYAVPLMIYTPASLCLKMCAFTVFNFYSRYWRYTHDDEIIALLMATTTSIILCVTAFFLIINPLAIMQPKLPQSIPFIDGILTMLMIGAVRFAVRITYVFSKRNSGTENDEEFLRVLIVGAGVAGSMIVNELKANPELKKLPVCFVDDDPLKLHLNIHGVEVVGNVESIPDLVQERGIGEIIIAMPNVAGKTINRIVQMCKTLNVPSKTIPGVLEILSGSAIAQLRDVQIEDLLRRETIEIDSTNILRLIKGARVMVTGAGGSIGSELCRQILSFRPKELVMLGHGENSIFTISNEMRLKHGVLAEQVKFTTVIADIRDRERMKQVFMEYRPQIIFHAAAHKHVGLMETNLVDAVSNNVMGTQNIVDLAVLYNVKKLVMISSDKAVNPTCVMGVTKRVAELVVRDVALRFQKDFVVVRFGNVLGSRGSIVPILKNQIQSGGPVTITDPNVTRFFMTIPEAVQLVLQSGAMGKCGDTYVLDMGEPIKIVDLAHDLIRLSGLHEGRDIDIVFTGLIQGEKMHEELFYEHELKERSDHQKIFVCKTDREEFRISKSFRNSDLQLSSVTDGNGEQSVIKRSISFLIVAAQEGNIDSVQKLLKKIIPQYTNYYFQSSMLEPSASPAANGLPYPSAIPEQKIYVPIADAGISGRETYSQGKEEHTVTNGGERVAVLASKQI